MERIDSTATRTHTPWAAALNFEEFSIICTTCSAGLKVREASAIGQIFGCPQCGSMVLVEAPEGMELPTESATGDESAPGEGVSSSESVPQQSPGMQSSNSVASASAAKVGWLGKALTAVAALVLVGSVGVLVWKQRSPSLTTPSQQVVDEEQTLATQTKPSDDLADSVPDHDIATSTIPEVVEIAQPAQQHPVSDQLVTDDVRVEEVFGEASLEEHDVTTPPEPSAQLSDAVGKPHRETAAKVDTGQTLSNLATLLGGNDFHSSDPDSQAILDNAAVEATKAEPETLTNTALANVHVTPRKVQASHEFAAQSAAKLERKITAARFNKVPLLDFLRTMMQLSGVPIQLDSAVLSQTAVRPSTPVSVAAIDKSTVDILRLALRPVQLSPVVDGNVVRITSSRVEDDSNRTMSFYVADLQAGRGGELDLSTFVQTLVAPSSWKGDRLTEVAGDNLNATNSRRVLFEVLVFIEKLRAARGLDARKKLPTDVVRPESRWSQTNRYLDRPISTNLWQPEPWPVVVEHLETAIGLQILVDWKSLGRVGVTPQTEMSLAVRGKLAGTVLSDALDSFGLALVPLGGKNLRLTSVSAMTESAYLDFYPIKELSDPAMTIVEDLMLSGKAALDTGSDFAVVLGNSELHRRLAQ